MRVERLEPIELPEFALFVTRDELETIEGALVRLPSDESDAIWRRVCEALESD